jgi:CBS domain-containing protein
MREYQVADWMSTPPIMIVPTLSLAEAQQLMEQRHIHRLPVAEQGRLIGILSWGDLRAAQPSSAATFSAFEWRALLDQVTVASCMTRDPVAIAPDATTLEAAQKMLEHKIGGLPVVDGGRVVGVITESDLFRLMIADASGEAHADPSRPALVCQHCGAIIRGRSLTTIGPNDECWRCHYHLQRCENCRFFDGVGCLLGRPARHEVVPGRRCSVFTYLPLRAAGIDEHRSSP